MKAYKFAKMIQPFGYPYIEYANFGSDSLAQTKVEILNETEYSLYYPPLKPGDFHGSSAVIGSPGWIAFDKKLREELRKRVQPRDIILHPFGRSHAQLVGMFPEAQSLETGIGYPDHPIGAWRIFESESWRHYHWGHWDHDATYSKDPGNNRFYSKIIPNYFDLDEWDIGDGSGGYVLFMARIDQCKGILTIADIIKVWDRLHPDDDLRFVFAGQGSIDPVRVMLGDDLYRKRVDYRGPVLGRDRSELCGKARVMLCPTNFVEPFGGSAIEAMLTGTPVIASDWGAYTETVIEGVNGYRCKTMKHWIAALEKCMNICVKELPPPHYPNYHTINCGMELHRAHIAVAARAKYSLQTCGKMYAEFFEQLNDLYKSGWYEL